MSWDYRMIKQHPPDGEPWYAIHEVYYDESGAIDAWTAEAMAVESESEEGLGWILEEMQRARRKPLLDSRDLPGGEPVL